MMSTVGIEINSIRLIELWVHLLSLLAYCNTEQCNDTLQHSITEPNYVAWTFSFLTSPASMRFIHSCGGEHENWNKHDKALEYCIPSPVESTMLTSGPAKSQIVNTELIIARCYSLSRTFDRDGLRCPPQVYTSQGTQRIWQQA